MRILPAVSLLLLLASCEVHFDWSWNKRPEGGAEAKPSGKTVTEDRAISGFSRIRLEGLGKLILDPAVPAGTVRVTADQGILGNIRTEVSGDQLVLKDERIQSFSSFQLEFRVAAPAGLSELTLAGLGSIEGLGPVKTGDVDVLLEGLGKIDLSLEAGTVTLRQQGQGDLTVSGTAARVEIRSEGLGKVDARALKAREASVENDGLGEVWVYATGTLKVRANGIGAVHFLGHPAQTDVQTEGLTKVSAAD